jgi:hypothetical protein
MKELQIPKLNHLKDEKSENFLSQDEKYPEPSFFYSNYLSICG